VRGVSGDASVVITIKTYDKNVVSSILKFTRCIFYSIPGCRYQQGIVKESSCLIEILSRLFDDALTSRISVYRVETSDAARQRRRAMTPMWNRRCRSL